MYVTLDWQSLWTAGLLQLLKRKVAQLQLKSVHQAKKDIFPIKFAGIPGPIAVWGEILHLGFSAQSLLFLAIKFGKTLANILIHQGWYVLRGIPNIWFPN